MVRMSTAWQQLLPDFLHYFSQRFCFQVVLISAHHNRFNIISTPRVFLQNLKIYVTQKNIKFTTAIVRNHFIQTSIHQWIVCSFHKKLKTKYLSKNITKCQVCHARTRCPIFFTKWLPCSGAHHDIKRLHPIWSFVRNEVLRSRWWVILAWCTT